jgi:xylulokinase
VIATKNHSGRADFMSKYFLAHDAGTSGNKAVLVDETGNVCAAAFVAYSTHYPFPDWAEQEPEDWWAAIIQSTRQVMDQSGISPNEIIGIAHTTQLLGIVPIGGSPPQPLRPAIIWLDGRAPKQADALMRKFLGPGVFALVAGAALSGKDALPKLLWLKEKEPEIYRKMDCFLDVNGYLIYRATGEKATDWSCASSIGFDMNKKDWLRGVAQYIGLDVSKFPRLVRSTEKVGGLTKEAADALGLLEGTPVFGGGGDIMGAAVGAGAVCEGDAHIYLGTSGWVSVTTKKIFTGHDSVVCLQSTDPEKVLLVSEMETAGACLKWIADNFYQAEKVDPNIPNVYALMDQKTETIPPGSDGLICTPWIYGERSPVTDVWVRSTFFNISAEHTREHMMRAVYEGVAYNLRWMIEVVEKQFHYPVPVLRLIGGGARGNPWMQIIADVTGRKVEVVANPLEAGAVGIALTSAVGLGLYPDFTSLKKVIRVERRFEPQSCNAECYSELFRAYQRLYTCLHDLYREVNDARFRKCQECL